MIEIFFTDLTYFDVKKNIFLRRLKCILNVFFKILLFLPIKFIKFIKGAFEKLYLRCYPKSSQLKRFVKSLIFLYFIGTIILNICLYYLKNGYINTLSIILFPVIIVAYFLIKFLLIIYRFFVGEELLNQKEVLATEKFIVNYLKHLLKVFGNTGAGKDTLISGCSAVLARSFSNKCIEDMEKIREICYIFDFDKLDKVLIENSNLFLSFSKEIIEANFIGDETRPGIAIYNQMFINPYYIHTSKITPEKLVKDYRCFVEDPISYPSIYAAGTRVNRKHFLQIIMEEYIQWFIRINVEQNFIITNQPYIEDLSTGKLALEFSYHFLKTRHEELSVPQKNGKNKKLMENIFFPWKDRLILSETECGTWWTNKEDSNYLIKSGIRDFKGFQRQFISDFYWFQADQAAGRTQALFRELDHGYAGVLSRKEIAGGRKENLFLEFIKNYYQRKIKKFENKSFRQLRRLDRKETKLNDLMDLYKSTNDEKFFNKHYKLTKKLQPKPYTAKYYVYKNKVANLQRRINDNLKNGYIILDVCLSNNGNMPGEYKAINLSDIVNSGKPSPASFVGRFTFRTSDCERYDTRYMRNLAESKAKDSKLVLNNVRRWSKNFKMEHDDLVWLAYPAAKEMAGITDEEYLEFQCGQTYKKLQN